MAGFLFHDIIFGPVKSRRLGVSLGINPLPVGCKLCTFNCIYCECGWTEDHVAVGVEVPSREILKEYLERKLIELKEAEIIPDSLTFAGNGEPTIHPDFSCVIEDTIALRDKYFPQSKITVLSNSTTLQNHNVVEALKKIDQNILKLDAGLEETYQKINLPQSGKSLDQIVEQLIKFDGNIIIQTLFLRGTYRGEDIDNTNEMELGNWLGYIEKIKPKYVMIYPIDRATPAEDLVKVSRNELEIIGSRVEKLGIPARVYD